MTITVKDVARKANVATSTVSRVINDHPSISQATKKKVQKVMDELGYVPNISARNLGKRTTSAVGIILPPLNSKERLANPFFLEIIEAINGEARKHNLTTALAIAKGIDTLFENVKAMHTEKQVGGFIITYSVIDDPIIDYLRQQNIPFVLIGQPYDALSNTVYVDNDNQLLGQEATDYLIKNGHQNILFITNTTTENIFYERYFGYQKAMMMAQLDAHQSLTLNVPDDYVKLEEKIQSAHATAIIALDDIFALRIIQLVELYGYKVPDDISIISFNNSIFSTLTHPYLTTLDIETEKLGQKAMYKLSSLIKGDNTDGMRFVIPHKLIERETVIAKKHTSK
ncbi:LacI family transcriptional regulator [Macrococcus armenti]|nr:LacI family DNA-binding transcriptional regulator [Macrococcus armenti]UBH16489.1 LacI family transcriptional regulator [Macrococcus armenti]UBH18843.1 LacI family transcriptional regulator [Macrococcus armenti]UBH20326.1 LacI family transcriptional regulator [Macrococcus armenti]